MHIDDEHVFAVFLVFCRIGGCMLFAPGYSSARISMNIRLFMALALTVSLSPLLQATIYPTVSSLEPVNKFQLVISETLIGSSVGLMARFFFLALQFATTSISNFIGLAGIPGIPLEEADTGSPLATLTSSSAIMIVFAADLHMELVNAILDSYRVLEPGMIGLAAVLPGVIVTALGETTLLALRLCAPFLVYGLIVNIAIGLGNRFALHISLYHATTGLVMLGGFLLFYVVWTEWMLLFVISYGSWLRQGGF